MGARESKAECIISFSNDRNPSEISPRYPVVIHLVEHVLNGIEFWYGVAQTAIVVFEIREANIEEERTTVIVEFIGRGQAHARIVRAMLVLDQTGLPVWSIGLVGVTSIQPSEK